MHTRPLRPGDFSGVKDLFKKTFSIPVGDLYISWYERSKKDSIGIFVRCEAGTRCEAGGCEAGGCEEGTRCEAGQNELLIGFVIASFSKSSGKSMYIDYFALAEEYRGGGLGTKLLLDLVTECYDMRGSIHLYPEREDIVSWYERNGFLETRGGYYVFHSYNTRRQGRLHRAIGLS